MSSDEARCMLQSTVSYTISRLQTLAYILPGIQSHCQLRFILKTLILSCRCTNATICNHLTPPKISKIYSIAAARVRLPRRYLKY